jgi:hypothetical protein
MITNKFIEIINLLKKNKKYNKKKKESYIKKVITKRKAMIALKVIIIEI